VLNKFSPEKSVVYEKIWKNMVESDRPSTTL